jgi:anti-sigma B factor antagonist
MALSIQTQISGDVFILSCDGRIVFGDECAVLRERIVNMLPGTSKIVLNLKEVDYIDSGGLGMLVGLLVSARNRGGELKLASPHERVKHLSTHKSRHNIQGAREQRRRGRLVDTEQHSRPALII